MSLLDLAKEDPTSRHFVMPPGKTNKDLLRLMLGVQKKQYGKTILETQPELTYLILRRNIKLLMKKYPLDEVKRGIMMAGRMSEHPFSTKVVREQIEWRLEQLKSPVLPHLE